MRGIIAINSYIYELYPINNINIILKINNTSTPDKTVITIQNDILVNLERLFITENIAIAPIIHILKINNFINISFLIYFSFLLASAYNTKMSFPIVTNTLNNLNTNPIISFY